MGELGDAPARDAPGSGLHVRQLRARRSSSSTRSSRPSTRRSSVRHHRGERSDEIADVVATAVPGRLSSHNWRAAAAGNEGGWQVARCLWLLNVLTGSVGTEGGVSPNGWNKFIPVPPRRRPSAGPMERSHLAGRVPARPPRGVDPAAALPQGGSWQDRHLLQPGLQPGVDQPRRVQLARGADRRVIGRLPCGAHADVVGERLVRRLRAANGHRRRASRPGQLRDAQRSLDRVPPTRVPGQRRERRAHRSTERGRRTRARCGKRTSSGSISRGRSTPTTPLASVSTSSRPTNPGEPLGIDEYYDLMFRHSIPGLPDAAAARGARPARVHAQVRGVRDPRRAVRRARTHRHAGRHRQDRRGPQTTRVCTRFPALPGLHDVTRRHRRAHAVHRRWFDRGRDRRQGPVRIPDSVAQTRDVLADVCATGVGPSTRCPGSSRAMCTGKTSTSRMANASCCRRSVLPTLIHTRSGPGQVAQRDQPRATRCGSTPPTPSNSASTMSGLVRDHHPDRLLRHQGVAHRRHPPRRRRRVAPHGSLATRREPGHPALLLGLWPRSPDRPQASARAAARTAEPGSGTMTQTERRRSVRVLRSRLPTGLVERRRRAPEPHLPSPARSGLGHALLAAASHRVAAHSRTIATATSPSTPVSSTEVYREWLAKTRPGPGPGGLRRPLWLARPVKPTATAYASHAEGCQRRDRAVSTDLALIAERRAGLAALLGTAPARRTRPRPRRSRRQRARLAPTRHRRPAIAMRVRTDLPPRRAALRECLRRRRWSTRWHQRSAR